MGPEADHMFNSFVFADADDEKDYEIVLRKFYEHFIPKRNVTY